MFDDNFRVAGGSGFASLRPRHEQMSKYMTSGYTAYVSWTRRKHKYYKYTYMQYAIYRMMKNKVKYFITAKLIEMLLEICRTTV